MRYHITPIKMTIIKRQKSVDKDVEKSETCAPFVGM